MPIHIPIKDESWPVSIVVNTRYRTIYVLRARCEYHELDKMHPFYLIGFMTLEATARQLRSAYRKAFRKKFGCNHKLKFNTETETENRWDTKLNKAVEAQS